MVEEIFERHRGPFRISCDRRLIDVDTVHAFLRRSYWAADRSRAEVERTIAASLCFGLYEARQQIGFARVVSDYVGFAWLCDVFVAEAFRGRELGTWLVGTVLDHPELRDVRRWLLATRDAHGLYERFGFASPSAPGSWLEKCGPSTKPA